MPNAKLQKIKLTSDTTLLVVCVLFVYIHWTVYRIESGNLSNWTFDEISNVTINLFNVMFLLSVVSMISRGIVLKAKETKIKLNLALFLIATIPLVQVLVNIFRSYAEV